MIKRILLNLYYFIFDRPFPYGNIKLESVNYVVPPKS